MARRAREAQSAATKAQRRATREKLGRLRDQQVHPRTLRRYRRHVQEFYRWIDHTGREIPGTVTEFDTVLCAWAAHLWAEGDAKSILNNGLCGLAHFVPALRGQLYGVWRLYRAWSRAEKPVQAPPMVKVMAQAFAGWFESEGHPGAATMILVAFHCILRTNEFFELRTGDVSTSGRGLLLQLRDTKIGQRLGIHQEVALTNPWLCRRVREAVRAAGAGHTLLGMTPYHFRRRWALARVALRASTRYTPYSLRRGGATAWFQYCGSFDKVADKGRWQTAAATRQYITTALLEVASEDILSSMGEFLRRYANRLA